METIKKLLLDAVEYTNLFIIVICIILAVQMCSHNKTVVNEVEPKIRSNSKNIDTNKMKLIQVERKLDSLINFERKLN